MPFRNIAKTGDKVSPSRVLLPEDESRLFWKLFECLCSLIVGKVLVHISKIIVKL
jgi:hypothetical protein